MFEVFGIIMLFVGLGLLLFLGIKDSIDARRLYKRKVEALEVIATEIRLYRRNKLGI